MRAPALFATFVAALVLSAGNPVAAQEKGAKKGLTGVSIALRNVTGGPTSPLLAKPRRFVPVTVVIANDGTEDQEGLLRVYRRVPEEKGQAPSTVPEQGLFYERPIRLPRGGKRTEELDYYVQDREPDRLCVSFETATGQVEATFPKLEFHPADVLALSITTASDDEAIRADDTPLPGPRRPYKLRVRHADVASLPERPEGYGPFDLVVLSDVDPRAVTERQVRALLQWVQAGGDLLVAFSGKASEGMGGFDDAVLPVVAAPDPATEERSLVALEALAPETDDPIDRAAVLVRRVKPRRAEDLVLAGTREQPLIVRGRYGAGRITYFAFPLAALRTWSGARNVLALAARPPVEDLEATVPAPPSPPLEEALQNLTEALRPLEPPSTLVMGPLLILYVALVAPLNYLVLTRLGKRDYAMLSAAIIAVAFGGLFYAIGWIYKGSRALVARAAIVELAGDPRQLSRVESLTGFFSTDRGVLDGKAPQGSSIAPIAETEKGRSARVLEVAGGETSLASVELDTWSLRRFRTTRLAELGALVTDLRLAGGHVVGTVENRTKFRLDAPTIYLGERVIESTRDLNPGEKWEIDAATLGRASPENLYRLETRALRDVDPRAYRARFGEPNKFGGDPFQNDARSRLRASIERRAAAMRPLAGTIPALVVAVADQDLGGVDLDARASVELARAIVLSETAVVSSAGADARVVGAAPNVAAASYYEPVGSEPGSPARLGSGPNSAPGKVVYEWRLPSTRDLPFVARELRFNWSFAEEPEQDTIVASFYDWTQGKFVEFELKLLNRVQGESSLLAQVLPRVVEPRSGVVRIQLENRSTKDLLINRTSLTYGGSRPEPR